MTKEKLNRLQVYLNNLNNRLTSPVPSKHKDHPETFKNFLKNEIRIVSEQLEAVRLEGVKQ